MLQCLENNDVNSSENEILKSTLMETYIKGVDREQICTLKTYCKQ